MERMAWNQDWELGEPRLDGQHRAMVESINRLADATQTGQSRQEVRKAISFLLVYMDTHFKQEEAVMAAAEYPDLLAHRRKHEACAQKIDDLLERYRLGASETLAELVNFYQYWLAAHFQSADQDLSAFLKARKAS